MDNNITFKPSERFLYLTIIVSALVVSFFVLLGFQTHKYHEEIVNLYCAESITSVDDVRLNESITALLDLELERIQQGLTLLTIWAGIMMIVFLVFSLYSMHRSDELEKEGKDALDDIHCAIESMNQEAQANIESFDKQIEDEKKKFYAQIAEHKNEYEKFVEEKKQQFEDIYKTYNDKLNKATGVFNDGMLEVIQLLKQEVEEEDMESTIIKEE